MRSLIRELIETVILALLIFLALQFSVQNFRVEGSSMQPTLEEGQYLLVNKIVYFHLGPSDLRGISPFGSGEPDESVFPVRNPKRGDVIIFHYPRDVSRDFVKRVIGLPGDSVEIHQGQVLVNGFNLEEPYITRPDKSSMSLLRVGPDAFFVLGDNRRASNDSRDWGTVPTENIIGRAWVSYWPIGQFHSLHAFHLPF
ncbi:MAG: signal peptidase I [SAR202 cluster bacterium Casp-Chloro-G4]|nr:signal peptidase I [Chloroflexota bacterium]MDA1228442.1 signal peptidase I [Chloroflexota bacterium]PKB61740.1 MAG: signal peptidase I [SAR202 cluster bacterium Casp-Chloro-G4]